MSATESGDKVYPVDSDFRDKALIDNDTYLSMYQQSIADPEGFWAEQANCIDWMKPFSKVKDVSYQKSDCHIRWFEDGTLNVSVNCLDRHLQTKGDSPAIVWEGDDPANDKTLTYNELHTMVCQFANGMREQGVQKGDVVTIYMPMIPEAAAAMLACARIGAIHSVVFGGFSPEAIAGRIDDCDSKFVITADEGVRGGRAIPLKANVDAAIELTKKNTIEKVFMIRHTGADVNFVAGRDVDYKTMTEHQPTTCVPEEMSAEDPLFVLYTSGSTGKPKGVLHTSGGYLVYANMTFKYIFDYRDSDVYWCTADVGWITGHTYMVYGPLSNGAITVLAEGLPNWPDSSRIGKIVDKHNITILYTAPTAIRALMRDGDAPIQQSSRSTLRLMGSVGEPINPEAWEWYHSVIGNGSCPIVDTWWQTETGGVLITPLPGATDLKP
ncbi:MAG: acetate--CoA ligase, partial [Gammaproteobacteria bacterium]